MSGTKKGGNGFRIGDWVSFLYGPRKVVAQVIEDRGPLGINRRRIYRIRLDRGSPEPDEFEMPEDDLERTPPPDKGAVMKYLKDGGLVEILRSNLGGGKNQPKVWLTYTPRGEMTHTFIAERGVVGGETVPFWALLEDRVFRPKIDDVLSFLASFGLSRDDAEDVIATVGTAP